VNLLPRTKPNLSEIGQSAASYIMAAKHFRHTVFIRLQLTMNLHSISIVPRNTFDHKKPSCRWDSRPYCLTADYLVISDCC